MHEPHQRSTWFNIGFGQQPDVSSGFRQTFNAAQPHSLMRFVPHHIILPWLFGLKDFGPDLSNVINFVPKKLFPTKSVYFDSLELYSIQNKFQHHFTAKIGK